MLSAFSAQAIHEFKPRDKSKVESLLVYGDRLLIGLNTGTLRIYRVNEHIPVSEATGDAGEAAPPSPTKPRAVELLREEEKFSKRPVQQLAIVKEANLLVSLSDGYISLHDLQTYQLVERIEQTKGATCFTVSSNVVKDAETGVPSLVSRLAVGTKRRLICWTWRDMEMEADIAEVSLEASVKSLTWANGARIVVGMDPGFSIVDVETQEITPISKPVSKTATDQNSGELAGVRFGAVSSSGMGYMGMSSWVPKPMATGLSDGHVLVAKDVNTLFTDVNGKALERRQIPWPVAPEAVGYSYPYLLALLPPEKGTLQIRNPDTLSLLQSISVPSANIMHVPQPNISLAHAGKGFLVASDRVVWRMNALPYDAQLQELVDKQRFDEAVSLLNLLEDTLLDDKLGRIREIKVQKAISLFQQQKYRPALDLFTDAEAPPERVIALYPKEIAGELSSVPESTDQSEVETTAEDGENSKPDEAASKEPPANQSKGMLSKFKSSHARKDSDVPSIKSSPRTDSDNMSIRPSKGPAAKPAADKPLEGDDLKFAVRCLCSYLAQARVQIQKHLNTDGTLKENPPALDPETRRPAFANLLPSSTFHGNHGDQDIEWQSELISTAQLVDTTLFRAYMLALPSLAGPLFRLDNFCHPVVVQASLYENDRYGDLIDFLHGKKLHRQALEMLNKFGKDEADAEVPEGMRGPKRTVAYLKQLPPELIDIILEFVKWPMQSEPKTGMEVFLADTENAEHLPRDKVLRFLGDFNGRFEVQYLEHIIFELGDQDSSFHQQLLHRYVDDLKRSDLEPDQKEQEKTKLEAFLRKSKVYNQVQTWRELPDSNPLFYESRALVCSAMGNHKQALAIYVFKINDYDKAEDYCNRIYLVEQTGDQQACLLNATSTHEKPHRPFEPEDTPNKPNIFAILLGLYLRPPSAEAKRWPQALDLLSRHGARLPASSTLDLMPDDLAVRELQDYFRGRIRNATSILRKENVIQSLESVRRVNAERVLLLGPDKAQVDGKPHGRNRRVRITEEDHCAVCHKRFGASAVRVYPDNEVVHYGCVNRRPNDGGVQKPSSRGRGW